MDVAGSNTVPGTSTTETVVAPQTASPTGPSGTARVNHLTVGLFAGLSVCLCISLLFLVYVCKRKHGRHGRATVDADACVPAAPYRQPRKKPHITVGRWPSLLQPLSKRLGAPSALPAYAPASDTAPSPTFHTNTESATLPEKPRLEARPVIHGTPDDALSRYSAACDPPFAQERKDKRQVAQDGDIRVEHGQDVQASRRHRSFGAAMDIVSSASSLLRSDNVDVFPEQDTIRSTPTAVGLPGSANYSPSPNPPPASLRPALHTSEITHVPPSAWTGPRGRPLPVTPTPVVSSSDPFGIPGSPPSPRRLHPRTRRISRDGGIRLEKGENTPAVYRVRADTRSVVTLASEALTEHSNALSMDTLPPPYGRSGTPG